MTRRRSQHTARLAVRGNCARHRRTKSRCVGEMRAWTCWGLQECQVCEKAARVAHESPGHLPSCSFAGGGDWSSGPRLLVPHIPSNGEVLHGPREMAHQREDRQPCERLVGNPRSVTPLSQSCSCVGGCHCWLRLVPHGAQCGSSGGCFERSRRPHREDQKVDCMGQISVHGFRRRAIRQRAVQLCLKLFPDQRALCGIRKPDTLALAPRDAALPAGSKSWAPCGHSSRTSTRSSSQAGGPLAVPHPVWLHFFLSIGMRGHGHMCVDMGSWGIASNWCSFDSCRTRRIWKLGIASSLSVRSELLPLAWTSGPSCLVVTQSQEFPWAC